jgi:ribonuclease P protein component
LSHASSGSLRTADFKRGLASRPRARSEHFMLHHVALPATAGTAELSTAGYREAVRPVDDCRLGLIVPKRHARRSVTRNLIKRQGRAAFAAWKARLEPGDWLLRLRSPYAPAQFASAASAALRGLVRDELQALFADASAPHRP